MQSFYRSFNMLLSFFCRKVVQNKNAKGSLDLLLKWPTKTINGPSFHPHTVDGDMSTKVQESRETRGNLTKGGSMEGTTDCHIESSIRSENVPVPKIEESLSTETRKASMDSRRIDGPCCWSIDGIKKMPVEGSKKYQVWTYGGSRLSVVS